MKRDRWQLTESILHEKSFAKPKRLLKPRVGMLPPPDKTCTESCDAAGQEKSVYPKPM